MIPSKITQRVKAVRSFNRFYTRQIGLLTDHLLDTPYSLSQARILYELNQERNLTAGTLASQLRVDKGYMSRMINLFERRGLISRHRSKVDGRRMILRLSGDGKKAFATLNRRAGNQVKAMLGNLSQRDQDRLVNVMGEIEDILSRQAADNRSISIRTHRPGDIGWIVQRHGVIYNQEYDWDETFEALVAEIIGQIIKTYDHQKDHIWIAELDGERVGSIIATKAGKQTAQLRLFLVEPWARGRGVGKGLLAECIRFAREAGYRKMKLWTQSCLDAARHCYQSEGFYLVSEQSHHSFGHDLVAQVWELNL